METYRKDQNIEVIKAALDNTFGRESSLLIFKTLKLVYEMDEDEVIANPAKFEQILKRTLGRSAYNILKDNSESK